MKLCILGGGGFRTPYVYQALLRDGGTPRITEVALYDIDEDRLRSMTMILEQFADRIRRRARSWCRPPHCGRPSRAATSCSPPSGSAVWRGAAVTSTSRSTSA